MRRQETANSDVRIVVADVVYSSSGRRRGQFFAKLATLKKGKIHNLKKQVFHCWRQCSRFIWYTGLERERVVLFTDIMCIILSLILVYIYLYVIILKYIDTEEIGVLLICLYFHV